MSHSRRPQYTTFSKVTDKFAAICYFIEGEPFQNLCRTQNQDGSYNYSDKCLTHLHHGFPPFSGNSNEYYTADETIDSSSSLAPYQKFLTHENAVAKYSAIEQSQIPPLWTILLHYWKSLSLGIIVILALAFAMFNYFVMPILRRRTTIKQHQHGMVILDEDGSLSIGKIKFHPDDVIRMGSRGTCVYKGLYEASQDCAIKRIVTQTISLADREVDFLRSLQHPNLVRYLATESDPQFIYIALELADFTLRILVDEDKWNDIGLDKVEICRQSASGLQYLHKLDIVHRDIKPENILISFPKRPNNDRYVLITDFGLSKQLTTSLDTYHSSNAMRNFDGTQGWMPPEIIKAKEETKNLAPSKSADIFSLGCVFYYIVFNGKHPFGSAPNEREDNIKAGNNEADKFDSESDLENETSTVSKPIRVASKSLVSAMTDHDATRRPPISSILKYPLFWSKKDQLQFLTEVSDRIDKDKGHITREIESTKSIVVGYEKWVTKLSEAMLRDMEHPKQKHRSYNPSRLQDLLRIIRNKKNHYNDCSPELKLDFGELPDEFYDYFSSKFPQLITQVYKVIQELKHEPKFKDYYCQDESYVFNR